MHVDIRGEARGVALTWVARARAEVTLVCKRERKQYSGVEGEYQQHEHTNLSCEATLSPAAVVARTVMNANVTQPSSGIARNTQRGMRDDSLR